MKKRLSTAAVLAVGATFVLAPSPAQAAGANHCWTNVSTGESACFATFAEVVSDLSGGELKVSGGPATFSQADATALDVVALSSVTVAIVYEDAGYGGSSNTYVVAGVCDANSDVDYYTSLVGTAWNDRISSFKSYNACETKLWSGVYAGSGYGWYTNSSNVGVPLNDAASSIQWR